MSSSWTVACLAAAITLAASACRPPPPAPIAAVEDDPWQTVVVPGAAAPLYVYPPVITRYSPRDRGAYVVHVRGATADTRRRQARALVHTLPGRDTDDVVGDDGFVIRLSATERARVVDRPDVATLEILQPADRVGRAYDRERPAPDVRIDLFPDATDGERDALVRWLAMRGGEVVWSGGRALKARLPSAVIAEAARVGIVRWIE